MTTAGTAADEVAVNVDEPQTYYTDLRFYINGQQHIIPQPAPSMLLVDYLRSTEVGLTGTKHACGQGGCGSCTVMLSYWDDVQQGAVNIACNSCLRPLASLDGMEITTVEGLGSVTTEVSPVQYAIAKNNGSQCGYCTPGFVMNMHALLLEKKDQPLTKKVIEQNFDGNICRCTGFRPILYAMKTFACDWSPMDEAGTPPCYVDPSEEVLHYSDPRGINEAHLLRIPRPLVYKQDDYSWYRPVTLEQLQTLLSSAEDPQNVKLVCGNTSVGIPGINPVQPRLLIDISHIGELRGITSSETHTTIGAATTYTELLNWLDEYIPAASPARRKGLQALHYMARRTAGKVVRNTASLAGNTMLVARNATSGTPFPSDLFVALSALGTQLSVAAKEAVTQLSMPSFIERYNSDKAFAAAAVILSYHIPHTKEGDLVQTYKVALRLENSHSLANAGFKLTLSSVSEITAATLVVGGFATRPLEATATAAFLLGKRLDTVVFDAALQIFTNELQSYFNSLPPWFRQLPEDGISDTYRAALLHGYFYKFFLYALQEVNAGALAPQLVSALRPEFERPVSFGAQVYSTYPAEYPVSRPVIKLTAFEQATGEAIYTHDISLPVKGVYGSFVISKSAMANFHYHVPGKNQVADMDSADEVLQHLKETFPGIVDYITYRDIPAGGVNGSSDPFAPDPVFATGKVSSYGQCIGLVVARNEHIANQAAEYLANKCIVFVPGTPILTIPEAIACNNIFPDYNDSTDDNECITKPGSLLGWILKSGPGGIKPGVVYGTGKLGGENCQIIAGTQKTGSQIHFYMETQACFSEPGERRQMIVCSSSQSLVSVQSDIATLLNVGENCIETDIKRLGGGYGGKTTRSTYVASPATLAAAKLRRPVMVKMPREADSYMIGHRHPFLGEYNIAVVAKGPDRGKIMGTVYEFYSDGGSTKDCSLDVMDCAVLGADSCYNVPNFQTQGHVCKTNLTSNGAMRSYGGVQCGLITEEAIEAAAFKIGMLPEELREKNFYQIGDKTPYGQSLTYCILDQVWKRIRTTSGFDERQAAVQKFNTENRWKKRGISMIPLKYGLGYNLGFLMQGGALVNIYASDGSVLVQHGGIEMGQGIMTKIAQIAAETLNIPLGLILMDGSRTSVISNAISTGATSGSDLNGGAVMQACTVQRQKLETLCLQLLQQNGTAWCQQQGINYWDYSEGWQAVVTTSSNGVQTSQMIWNNVVSMAYTHRVDLSSQALYSTPGLADEKDQQFYDYTYSAACAEVEIDVLTGESNILRADLLYDIGKSLNPAIDTGQIEGAFIMGVGYMLSEKLVWEPNGTTNPAGMLNTPNTWTYKVPTAASIPIDLRVDLFPRDTASRVPENPGLVFSSKGVGEPPLVLANSVFFAVKHAILAARKDRGNNDWFEMEAPATVEIIKQLCLTETKDLTIDIT